MQAFPDAVLWLLDGGRVMQQNLLSEAQRNGVDTHRIVFAPPLEHAEHVARLSCADLYLDTETVNGHTLAADAIVYAGLPFVTLKGDQFAARVGASFAKTAGMTDLIAEDLTQYRAILDRLLADPGALRQRRWPARGNPAFQSQSIAHALEVLFLQIAAKT